MTHPILAAPRELTPEEQEERAKQMFALHQRIITSLEDGRKALWSLAEALAEFDEEQGWLALGYENKSEWLADPEVGIKQVTYNRAIRRWRQMSRRISDQSALTELDPSKVDLVMPTIEANRKPLKDIIEDVKVLGWRDLRVKYLGEEEQVVAEIEEETDLPDVVIDGETASDNGNLPTTTHTGDSGQVPEMPTWIGLCPGDHTEEFYVPLTDASGTVCPACDEEVVVYERAAEF